jgi:hypothetical protein
LRALREIFSRRARQGRGGKKYVVRALMSTTLRNALLFLFANLLFTAGVITVYAVGYEYDKANKLHPESKLLSYDMSKQVYGQRWERVAKTLIGLGIVIDAAVILAWYRKRQSSDMKPLDITTTL